MRKVNPHLANYKGNESKSSSIAASKAAADAQVTAVNQQTQQGIPEIKTAEGIDLMDNSHQSRDIKCGFILLAEVYL